MAWGLQIARGLLVERFDRRFNHNHTQVQRKHTLQLLDWTIFNLLTGNADCHAKNLSFFVDAQGIELGPFYDLVNVMLFDFAHDWAMGLGDEFLDDGALPSTYHLACFAHACGLQGSLVSKRFEKHSRAIQRAIKKLVIQ